MFHGNTGSLRCCVCSCVIMINTIDDEVCFYECRGCTGGSSRATFLEHGDAQVLLALRLGAAHHRLGLALVRAAVTHRQDLDLPVILLPVNSCRKPVTDTTNQGGREGLIAGRGGLKGSKSNLRTVWAVHALLLCITVSKRRAIGLCCSLSL